MDLRSEEDSRDSGKTDLYRYLERTAWWKEGRYSHEPEYLLCS